MNTSQTLKFYDGIILARTGDDEAMWDMHHYDAVAVNTKDDVRVEGDNAANPISTDVEIRAGDAGDPCRIVVTVGDKARIYLLKQSIPHNTCT